MKQIDEETQKRLEAQVVQGFMLYEDTRIQVKKLFQPIHYNRRWELIKENPNYNTTVPGEGEELQQLIMSITQPTEQDTYSALHQLLGNTWKKDWGEYLERLQVIRNNQGGKMLPSDGLVIDPKRGSLATYLNACLGEFNGMEPGKRIAIGGAPGGGKTSLGGLFVCDALNSSIPVLVCQLELTPVEMLKYILANNWPHHGIGESPKNITISERLLGGAGNIPDSWDRLLEFFDYDPAGLSNTEQIIAKMGTLKQQATAGNRCRGLVLVDYAQLLDPTKNDRGQPSHEALFRACSSLAKAAGDNDQILVILSQLTKTGQKGSEGATAFSGADINRIGDVSFMVRKASMENTGGPWSQLDKSKDDERGDERTDPDKGRGRVIELEKDRGTYHHLTDSRLNVWVRSLAFVEDK